MRTFKIGELARRAGLTVRTLHHYDELGLLCPAERSRAGYRLYSEEDLARLTRILLLRTLGLPLAEIRRQLAREETSLVASLEEHIARLREQIAFEERLLARLETLVAKLDRVGEASVEELIDTLEMIKMYEKYFTPEQLETLEKRKAALGPEQIAAAEEEWPELIARVRAARDAGKDPADPEVRALARRWQELVEAFTGGDAGIAQSVKDLYRGEPGMSEKSGLDPSLFPYVSQALAAEKEV